jgi:hypothetical protein
MTIQAVSASGISPVYPNSNRLSWDLLIEACDAAEIEDAEILAKNLAHNRSLEGVDWELRGMFSFSWPPQPKAEERDRILQQCVTDPNFNQIPLTALYNLLTRGWTFSDEIIAELFTHTPAFEQLSMDQICKIFLSSPGDLLVRALIRTCSFQNMSIPQMKHLLFQCQVPTVGRHRTAIVQATMETSAFRHCKGEEFKEITSLLTCRETLFMLKNSQHFLEICSPAEFVAALIFFIKTAPPGAKVHRDETELGILLTYPDFSKIDQKDFEELLVVVTPWLFKSLGKTLIKFPQFTQISSEALKKYAQTWCCEPDILPIILAHRFCSDDIVVNALLAAYSFGRSDILKILERHDPELHEKSSIEQLGECLVKTAKGVEIAADFAQGYSAGVNRFKDTSSFEKLLQMRRFEEIPPNFIKQALMLFSVGHTAIGPYPSRCIYNDSDRKRLLNILLKQIENHQPHVEVLGEVLKLSLKEGGNFQELLPYLKYVSRRDLIAAAKETRNANDRYILESDPQYPMCASCVIV